MTKIEVQLLEFSDIKKANGTKFVVFARAGASELKDEIMKALTGRAPCRAYIVLEPVEEPKP